LHPPAPPTRQSERVRRRPLHSQKRPRRDEAAHTRRLTASVTNESRSIHCRPGMLDSAKNADALCILTTYRPRRRSVTEKAAVPRAEGRGLSRSREAAARGPNPLRAGQRLSHRGGRPVRRTRRPAAAVEKSPADTNATSIQHGGLTGCRCTLERDEMTGRAATPSHRRRAPAQRARLLVAGGDQPTSKRRKKVGPKPAAPAVEPRRHQRSGPAHG
jgi:hypothetical protein